MSRTESSAEATRVTLDVDGRVRSARIVSVGDLDGDGRADACVMIGREWIGLSVPSGSILWRRTVKDGVEGADVLCAGIEDVDGDGKDDLLIAYPRPRDGGRFTIVQKVSSASGAVIRESEPTYGTAPVSGLPRTKSEGAPYLLVSTTPFADGGTVHDARTDRQLNSLKYSPDGLPELGWAMAGGADFDGDGVPDWALTRFTPYYSGRPNQGVVVFSGVDGKQLRCVRCEDL